MDGSSIPLPSFRTIGKKEPDQPKSLPFSFKRQDPVQKHRNNSPKPTFFDNPNPRVNSSNNNLIQTQSFRLPENVSRQPSIKNSNSKPFISSQVQAHSDLSQRLRQPNSQIARPIFGSLIKPSLKIEENASIPARQSSPLGGDQAHIPTFEQRQVEEDTKQYSPQSSSGLQAPIFPSLVSSSSSSRLLAMAGQQPLHSNSFSSSCRVQNFPESPDDIQFESSRVRASSRVSTNQSEPQSEPQHVTPPNQNQNPHMHMHHHSNRSRSTSIIMRPLDIDDNDDDMNTSAALLTMTNNANSLRMAKFEIAEGKRHIESLESQLDTIKSEKAELSRRLSATKEVAKKAIESSAKSLDELKTSFKSLKKTSDESAVFVAQVRSSMTEFEDERKDAAECLKKIEPLLNEDGEYLKGSETKSLVNELQVECEKTQEVAAMLREKLITASGDLVEAKSRVRELEVNLLDEKMRLNKNTETLLASSQQMSQMASFLNQQKHESLDALSCAAEAEGRFHTANERIVELSQALDYKVEQLTAVRGVQQENSNLRSQLEAKDAEIVSLGSTVASVNQTLSDARECLQEQKSKVQVLHTTISFQEQNLKDFEDRTLKAETQTSESSSTVQDLREKVQQLEAREVAEGLKRERLVCERDAAVNRVRTLESEVGDAKRRIGERDEKLHQANTQNQVLQERFDDQSVTLRITKESSGDLNERLMSAENSHAATITQLQLEIAVLQEQKMAQLDKLDVFKVDSKHRQESDAAIMAKYQDQLSRQESDNKRTIQTLEQRVDTAERDLAEANRSAEVLRTENNRKSLEKIPSTTHKEEISVLEARLQEQLTLVEFLTQRANTIGKRYKEGDLSDAEAAFAHSLIKKAEALHEQENVSKANELRRRDNTISTLESKIGILESEVARLLNAETKSKTPSGVETRSMMDVVPFIHSSSPFPPVDADAPSQNDDSTAAVRPSSEPAHLASSNVSSTRLRITNHRAPDTRMAHMPGPSSAKLEPLRPIARTNFARLDTDASDDIIDDDGPLSPPPKLGKRDRLPPIMEEYSSTRKTRFRTGTRQQETLSAEPADPPPKSKSRKRR